MKYLLILCFGLVLQAAGCRKDKEPPAPECTLATITNAAPGCGGWGIVVNGVKYPSENIPSEFQRDGLGVCTVYELYDDARVCPCCGGVWARIISMRYVGR